ncbi:MAG: Hsp70 family protein [Polyangiaceae bacterium]|nr:Hsp70 family protein [Polyangiaceae bacterium]
MSVSRDRAVGIDLGTTNSEIAWLPPSEREVLIYADKFGRKTVASAVAWDAKQNMFVVGHAARARRASGQAPVESIKRKMGQAVRTRVGTEALLPEEISAKILGELTSKMAEYMAQSPHAGPGAPITRAVITVPAYFDAPQVEATRKAGELAGLSVIGILQEPTAAAIYQTWKHEELAEDGNVLVYDLGGGTFDVSILRALGGEYQVLAIDGDNYLGGDDFDRRFAETLRLELCAKGYALDLDVGGDEKDRAIFQRLVNLAQEIKESLSTTDVLHVAKHDFCSDKDGELVSYEGDIGRADYEKAIGDLVESTIACCERAIARSLETAGVGLDSIDHVILVGGSTRVPLVIERVKAALVEKTRGQRLLQDEVDTCVALGAAIHAAQVGGLVIEDAEQKARVRIQSPLVSSRERIRVSLRVEAAPPGTSELALWAQEEPLAQGPLPAEGESRVLDVALGELPETAVSLAFQSKLGAPLAQLPLTLYRGDLRPRPTALTRAAVLAKDIGIEVVRAGKRDRRVILARGTGLPAQVSRVFFTVDQTGSVLLRLLQNRLPIKTLAIDVPKDLPVGSPVEVTLTCDESMRIEARAEVGAQTISAVVDAPDAAGLDPEGTVERILEEADASGRQLWGSIGDGFRREADRLTTLIREALRTDPDKVPSLSHRLRDLIEEHRGTSVDAMAPPLHIFEAALDRLRRIVYRIQGELVGMTQAEWEKRIDDINGRARRAYEESDAGGWKRVNNEVQALLETAGIEEWSTANTDDPAYIQRRLNRAIAWAMELELRLTELTGAGDDAVEKARAKEAQRIRQWLEGGVLAPLRAMAAGDPKKLEATEANRKISDAFSELERMELAIDRLPSIGLVTDRGNGA